MFTRGHRSERPPRSHRRLAWVLALALLLPFAQALAWVHTLSHHGSPRTDSAAVQLESPCAVCLSAAPLHGGALPGMQPAVPVADAAFAAPAAADGVAPGHATTLAYLSRAPPLPC